MSEASATKLDTIKGLLNMAEDPALAPEAAENYRNRAIAMMAKYGIDQTKLSADDSEPQEAASEMFLIEGNYHNRRVLLLHGIAKGMRCQGIIVAVPLKRGQKSKNTVMWVYGMPSDIERVKLLFHALDLQMASDLAKSLADKPAKVHGRTWSVNFMTAFANKVAFRVREAENRAEQEEVQYGSDKFALVLVDNKAKVQALFDQNHRNTGKAGFSNARSSAGWGAGSNAGARANLGGSGSLGGSRRALNAGSAG